MMSLRTDVRMCCSGGTFSHRSGDFALRTYLADLGRPFGVGVREDQIGSGIAYGDMGAKLLADLQPADLLVLAFAVPDRAPWGSAASRLSSQCPGAPPAFAVCDQGTLAGFTALRLIGACLDAGQRGVLVVAEQPAVGYQLPAARAPARAAAVALVCEQTGPDEATGPRSCVRVTLHADLPSDRVPAVVAAELRELGGATLVAGNGLTGTDTGRLVRGPDRQPLTGVWQAAAGLIGTGPLLLADYDPAIGGLALCTIGP